MIPVWVLGRACPRQKTRVVLCTRASCSARRETKRSGSTTRLAETRLLAQTQIPGVLMELESRTPVHPRENQRGQSGTEATQSSR